MRILTLVDGLRAGGKERQLVTILKALSQEGGHSLDLVVMSEEIHYKEVLALPVRIHSLLRSGRWDPRIALRLFNLVRALRPQVIHAWDPMTAFYAIPASKLLGVPLVNGMVRNAPLAIPAFSKLWWYAKMTLWPADIVMGNTKAGLKAYGMDNARGVVVYNGFDPSRLANLTDPVVVRKRYGITTKFVVVMVASFSAAKDYETVIRAAAILGTQRSDVTIVAVGAGPSLEKYRELASGLMVHNLSFLGTIQDVESVVNISDIGILISFTEGLSNAIMEYMALSKPVIATAVQGNFESVEDGITGVLIPPKSPEVLVEKLNYLLSNPDVALQMGLAGKARLENTFSVETMIQNLKSVYNAVLIDRT